MTRERILRNRVQAALAREMPYLTSLAGPEKPDGTTAA
jgi:hypothetical protein